MPALNSYWIWIHVTAMTVAVGLFLVGAVATTLYLVAEWLQQRQAAGKRSIGIGFILHARATPGFRGAKAAFFHLIGFGCLLFNVVAVNLWVSGLHSYAGMH